MTEGVVDKHTAHYLDMVESVRDKKDHGYHFHHLMVVFQITGPFDLSKFRSAVLSVAAANPAMRTTFCKRDGAWVQRIAPEVNSRAFEHRDLLTSTGDWKKKAHDAILIENDTPFAMTDEPLMKVMVLEFPEAKVVFGKFHHIVCDGWGILVAMNQLLGFYMAELANSPAAIPKLSPESYLDFAQQENRFLASPTGRGHLDWWREYLAGHSFLRSPLPTRPPGFLGVCTGLLSERCNRRLAELAKEQGYHVSYLAHAAYLKALHTFLGQDDILITYVKANRNDANSSVIGDFADWVPVRHRLNLDRPLTDVARDAQRDVNEAKEHYLPYWHIVENVCPGQYLNDFGLTPYSFDFVPAFEPKVDFGGGVSFSLLHDLQVFPFRLTATDIFCRATQFRDPQSNELNLSIDLIYHSGFLSAEKVQAVSNELKAELENLALS
jgi:Condensation domain